MDLEILIKEAHINAVEHGFWDEFIELNNQKGLFQQKTFKFLRNSIVGNLLMLIVSEVGEAQDGLRHNDDDNFKEELADIVIRTFDLAGGLDIDLQAEIIKKMDKNRNRPYKHGKAF